MNGVIISSLLCIATFVATTQARGPSPLIVGGESTGIENYPDLVQVEFMCNCCGVWNQVCGGNILTSNYILSAAHCFSGWFYAPWTTRIRAGSAKRFVDGAIHYIITEYNHPEYALREQFDADITVVRLQTPLIYNDFVKPGVIVAQDSVISNNLPVVTAGWGHVEPGGPHPHDLQHAMLYTIDNLLCTSLYNSLNEQLGRNYGVTENMICAGLHGVGGRDACNGDSGGPLYYGDIIVGVVSWGHGCANETYPGVFTSIASYTDWVVNTIETQN